MDPHTQRSIDRDLADIDRIRQFLEKLTKSKLTELYRINDQPSEPDGFPAGGHGDGGRSTSETTSTEAAALRGLPEGDDRWAPGTDEMWWTTNAAGQRVRSDAWHRHGKPDPVYDQIQELLTSLGEMGGRARKGSRTLETITNRPDLLKAKEQVMDRCQACQRWVSGGENPETLADDIDDPLDVVAGYLRSGYCNACRTDFSRKPGMDRPAFEKMRLDRHTEAKAKAAAHAESPSAPVPLRRGA